MRRISDGDLQRTAHLTGAEAAEVLGVHAESVRRARRRRKAPLDLDFARALLSEGAPYPEVARTVGLSAAALRRRLPGYTVTAEHRHMLASLRARERELYDEFRR